MCDYRQVLAVKPTPSPKIVGHPQPGEQRYIAAPIVIFEVSDDRTVLLPRIIQLNRQHRPLIITGAMEEYAWRYAKTVAQCALFNLHEIGAHLTKTHFLSERIIMATKHCLPLNHPVHQLLQPHFAKTLALNREARNTLLPILDHLTPGLHLLSTTAH